MKKIVFLILIGCMFFCAGCSKKQPEDFDVSQQNNSVTITFDSGFSAQIDNAYYNKNDQLYDKPVDSKYSVAVPTIFVHSNSDINIYSPDSAPARVELEYLLTYPNGKLYLPGKGEQPENSTRYVNNGYTMSYFDDRTWFNIVESSNYVLCIYNDDKISQYIIIEIVDDNTDIASVQE